MDGFFVAKFHKTGPTPANAVLADRSGSKPSAKAAAAASSGDEVEVFDKSPIVDEDAVDGEEDDDFGGFDEDEDEQFIQRAKRNAMRRRGLDPKALNKNQSKKAEAKKDETEQAEPEKDESKKVETKKDVKKGKFGNNFFRYNILI